MSPKWHRNQINKITVKFCLIFSESLIIEYCENHEKRAESYWSTHYIIHPRCIGHIPGEPLDRGAPQPLHRPLLRGQQHPGPEGDEGVQSHDRGHHRFPRAGRPPRSSGDRRPPGRLQLDRGRLLRRLGNPRLHPRKTV